MFVIVDLPKLDPWTLSELNIRMYTCIYVSQVTILNAVLVEQVFSNLKSELILRICNLDGFPVCTVNLYNKDTIGTTFNCPVYGGVLNSEGFNMCMSVQGMSNGAERWCPVEGGGCISEVFLIEVSP